MTSSRLPSARKVSLLVHQAQVENKGKEQSKISQMVMQFGQFLDHDFTLTPEQERDCADEVKWKKDFWY